VYNKKKMLIVYLQVHALVESVTEFHQSIITIHQCRQLVMLVQYNIE